MSEEEKEEIESVLAKLMDNLPEIEGIIAFNSDGEIITGQTITEMDHKTISEIAINTLNESEKLTESIEKGNVSVVHVSGAQGHAILVRSNDLYLLAIAGEDATPSVGLIIRNLKLALEQLE